MNDLRAIGTIESSIYEWNLDEVPVGTPILIYWFDAETMALNEAKVVRVEADREGWFDLYLNHRVEFYTYDYYSKDETSWDASEFPTHWSFAPYLHNLKVF